MRTKKEMEQAVAILRKRGDATGLAQADIIDRRYTEVKVFTNYMSSIGEDERNKEGYFPLRDAARFVEGTLTLEELIPDYVPEDELPEENEPENTVTLTRTEFDALVARMDKLERWVGMVRRAERKTAELLPENSDMSDMMSQTDACEYIGCSKRTIKRWVDRGLLHKFRRHGGARVVFYCRKEIDEKMSELRNDWQGHASEI